MIVILIKMLSDMQKKGIVHYVGKLFGHNRKAVGGSCNLCRQQDDIHKTVLQTKCNIEWHFQLHPYWNRDVYHIECIGSYLYHKTDTGIISK